MADTRDGKAAIIRFAIEIPPLRYEEYTYGDAPGTNIRVTNRKTEQELELRSDKECSAFLAMMANVLRARAQ
jgi:hypothetical protein